MYLAKGIADSGNSAGYPAGEKHSMLIFLAGYRDTYDWQRAEQTARDRGWSKIDFAKAGRITRQDLMQQDRTVNACYAEAVDSGSSLLVYAPVEA